MKRICAVFLVLCLFSSCSLISPKRAAVTVPESRGAGAGDSFTLFWYVNGSDLESGSEDDAGGAFTDNLEEMLSALPPDERFRVVIFTGGTRDWKAAGFSSEVNQVHFVTQDGLEHGEVLPGGSIAEPSVLASFLQYGLMNFSADRYGLIFWDHGSGVPIGFGYDELREPRYMDLTMLREGLEEGLRGERLAFIGFDTCLMSTVETAAVCASFADILVASEELEPFGGWDYRPIMLALGEDPGLSAAEIGKVIMDGYFSARKNASETLTLSVTDLTMIEPVVEGVSALAEGLSGLLREEGFSRVSGVRARTKYYGGANQSVDMVDLAHLAQRLESIYPEEARRLIAAIKNCVVYNRHTASAPNSNGLSIYFPYENEGIFKNHLALYLKSGFSEPYMSFIREYTAQLEQGDASMYMVGLRAKRNGASYTAAIPPDWHIQDVQGVLASDEGFGVYLLKGIDYSIEFDEASGKVTGTPPQTWLTVNGAPAYAEGENGDIFSVLAELDGKRVSLAAAYREGEFTFLGAIPEAKEGCIPRPAYLPVEMGDTVTLLYPKLDTRRPEGGELYERGPSFTLSEPLEFGFNPVEGTFGFLLTDCYHNRYVTDLQ